MDRDRLNKLLQRLQKRTAIPRRGSPAVRYTRLAIEYLEDRMMPAIFTVNSTGDQPDPTPNNGVQNDCDPAIAGDQYTLRGAIETANSAVNGAGPDEIQFNLPGPFFTIKPDSALPAITEAVRIDGTSQLGFVGFPIIELDGSNAGFARDGLTIKTSNSTVQPVFRVTWLTH